MAFLDDVRKIEPLQPYRTGQRSQREKLNKGVGAVNEIIDAAKRHADQGGGLLENKIEVWLTVDGEFVLTEILVP